MAQIKPLVIGPILKCDDESTELFPHEEQDLYPALIRRSLEQLFNPHSKPEWRAEAFTWLTAPLVFREYIDPALKRALDCVVRQYHKAVVSGRMEFVSGESYSLPVRHLGLKEVILSLTDDFEIMPAAMTFEFACLKLDLNPEILCEYIVKQVHRQGIWDAIEEGNMLVQQKRDDIADDRQTSYLDTDYHDPTLYTEPRVALKGPRPYTKSVPVYRVEHEPPTQSAMDFGTVSVGDAYLVETRSAKSVA